MNRLSLCFISIMGIVTLTAAAPHHHDDPSYQFIKQLKKARKHASHGHGSSSPISFGNRDADLSAAGSNADPTSTPILFPSSNSQSSSGNSDRLPINLPQIPRPTSSSPADIQRVNSGVATILQGVTSFDLGKILRGAFIFPRNDNVRSVATTVLDNIFGPLNKESETSSGTGNSDAPSFRN